MHLAPSHNWKVFGEMYTAPTRSITDLLRSAAWVKHAIVGRVRPDGDQGRDQAVLEKTESEVAAGKALGPYTMPELDDELGVHWLPAPRVGLPQGEGVRPIDDFSIYGHNGSSETWESPASGGVDEIAGIIKCYMEAVAKGYVEMQYEDGSSDRACLHNDYAVAGGACLVGRTLDLEKAYKTLAPPPAFKSLMVVALWHPERRQVAVYRQLAMPFGARNSVFSFAGFGAALHAICTVLFRLVSSQFVDDFTQVTTALDIEARSCMEAVLDLLGWKYKESGDKALPFQQVFPSLGVLFDCTQAISGRLEIKDKPGRVEQVLEILSAAAEKGQLTAPAAESLRGKLQYTRSQTFGGAGAVGLQALGSYTQSGPRRCWSLAMIVDFWAAHFA